jgi:hypothetical protein
MTAQAEKWIAEAIQGAEEIQELPPIDMPIDKPRLLIENCSPDRTVAALRDILATAGGLFDRGVPVRIAADQMQGGAIAQLMTPEGLMRTTHTVCRPYALKKKPDSSTYEANAPLPRSIAVMYLDWRGEWRLPPLNGIATTPLLQENGAIKSAEGYDPDSGMWCEHVPDLTTLVRERPMRSDAALALQVIRETFKTFCFADADTIHDPAVGIPVVDISKPPGRDESTFLVALLTAVCRPSLHLAPGVRCGRRPSLVPGPAKDYLPAVCASLHSDASHMP